jgi:hypothetical protein
MKKNLLIVILPVLLFPHYSPAAQFPKSALVVQGDTTLSAYSESIDAKVLKKSPLMAFAIGFAPGFFIHGLGHFYAGNDKAGGWLLASEGISFLMVYYGVVGSIATMDCNDCNRSGIAFVGYTGLVMFFGGWIIDFADAPYQVNKHKAAATKMQKISMGVKKGAIVINYSFNL